MTGERYSFLYTLANKLYADDDYSIYDAGEMLDLCNECFAGGGIPNEEIDQILIGVWGGVDLAH